jgi:hypothetical protein
MVTYQYFSAHIFHIAENYLEASDRCLEGLPEEGSDAVNALLWPSEHCAIIACELFLKSLIAQTEKPDAGVIYTPTYMAVIPIEKKGKVTFQRPHINVKLIRYLTSTYSGKRVWEALGKKDQWFLLRNTHRFAGSRYPFELANIRPDYNYLAIARKLRIIITELIEPREDGNITLELKILDHNPHYLKKEAQKG